MSGVAAWRQFVRSGIACALVIDDAAAAGEIIDTDGAIVVRISHRSRDRPLTLRRAAVSCGSRLCVGIIISSSALVHTDRDAAVGSAGQQYGLARLRLGPDASGHEHGSLDASSDATFGSRHCGAGTDCDPSHTRSLNAFKPSVHGVHSDEPHASAASNAFELGANAAPNAFELGDICDLSSDRQVGSFHPSSICHVSSDTQAAITGSPVMLSSHDGSLALLEQGVSSKGGRTLSVSVCGLLLVCAAIYILTAAWEAGAEQPTREQPSWEHSMHEQPAREQPVAVHEQLAREQSAREQPAHEQVQHSQSQQSSRVQLMTQEPVVLMAGPQPQRVCERPTVLDALNQPEPPRPEHLSAGYTWTGYSWAPPQPQRPRGRCRRGSRGGRRARARQIQASSRSLAHCLLAHMQSAPQPVRPHQLTGDEEEARFMREFRAEFSDILGLGEGEISHQSVPLPDLWLPPVEDPWEWIECDRAARAEVWDQMHGIESEPEPETEPEPDQLAGSECLNETGAYSPQGTAREGYEPLDSSIAQRVMARHRDLEPDQSYSPGGTADAYEPLTVGARVHARHETSRLAYDSYSLPDLSVGGEGDGDAIAGGAPSDARADATAGTVAITATACAWDDDEMICMF